jgi:DNA-binding CsgD family transcriptional regulator/pimeloyl-ACP methyl ester carboxylesterase
MNPPPIQYVTTEDGYDIAFAVSGNGPPLILLPNAWSHIRNFWQIPWRRSLFVALAERFTLIQFDARGQGLSTRGLGAGHTMDAYCLDVEAVVTSLGLRRFVLMARNLLCQVALKYAATYPNTVEALILSNPVRDLYEGFGELREQRWELYTETIARMGGLPGNASELAAQFREAVTQADHIRFVETLRWHDSPVDFRSLTAPTLVVDSSTSPLHAHDWAAQLAAAILKGQLVTTINPEGGSGSFTAGSQPPPLAQIVWNFYEGLPSPSAVLADAISAREMEVLRLLAAGKSNQEIADELVISLNTVRRHVSNIFGKIDVVNRAQATAYAKDHGLA